MNIVCLASEKGGVGKSSCAVNLGSALARMKKKILLIDMDSQGSLTHHLSQECKDIGGNIVDVLDRRIPLRLAITECSPALHFIASNRKLSEYVEKDFRERLKEVLDELRSEYDYIFLDFPPMLSDFTVVLLASSDQVIVPVEGRGGLSLRGLDSQLETVRLVQESLNPDLRVEGIVVSRMAPRMKLCQEVLSYLHKKYKDRVYKTTLRESIKVAEAASVGKSIFGYSPRSESAREFSALAREFLARQKNIEKKKRK